MDLPTSNAGRQAGGPPAPAHLWTVASFKGGTGKSTTTGALGFVLAAHYGRRVALVDADPQASLTRFLGHEPSPDPLSALPVDAFGTRLHRGGRALARATPDRIATWIGHIRREADVVLVDVRGTAEDQGQIECLLRLPAARVLAVPAAEPRSIPELVKLVARVEDSGASCRIVVNRVVRRRTAQDVLVAIRGRYPALVLDPSIPELAEVWQAERRLRPVTEYRPLGRVSEAVRRVAAALVDEGMA